MTTDSRRLDHTATLSFVYPSEEAARRVERSIRPEVGAIDDDRSATRVSRDGATLAVRVEAADLVALRAATNTWLRLVGVAEDVAGGAGVETDGPGAGGGTDRSGK